MKRNVFTGEYTFNSEEVNTIALSISARCKDTLQWYRTTTESSNSGAAEYFANEFRAANKLYKEFFGTDYPVDIAEGPVPYSADDPVPTPDTTPDYTDC